MRAKYTRELKVPKFDFRNATVGGDAGEVDKRTNQAGIFYVVVLVLGAIALAGMGVYISGHGIETKPGTPAVTEQ